MEITLSSDADVISWEELAEIFERAPLGHRDPKRLEPTFRNSGLRCFAYAEGKLIGAGRALTDGVTRVAIYDVVVLPEYQNQGVGRQIMEHLIADARENGQTVTLYAVPGKEGFYRRFGFATMKTAMILSPHADRLRENGYTE